MAYLIKPDLNEMSFRQKLHESPRTMGGLNKVEPFPKEKWEQFYKENVDVDPKVEFYRYQYCPDCADFTGELGWKRNQRKKRYELFILIQYERRNEGYGIDGMKNLLKAAKKNGIAKLYAVVPKEVKAADFFSHIGMKREADENENIVFSALTKDDLH